MTATVTLEGPENLIAHIEGLQATLTKRNALIAQLSEELGKSENGEPTQKALNNAYKQGYQAAIERFGRAGYLAANVASELRAVLRKVHIDGYEAAETAERPYTSSSGIGPDGTDVSTW